MRIRAEQLRERGICGSGQELAGVCYDFGVLTTALLREAGFLAGVKSGYVPQGDGVRAGDSHFNSYVLWPSESGSGYKVIEIDGTPGSGQAEKGDDGAEAGSVAGTVARPLLRARLQRERSAKKGEAAEQMGAMDELIGLSAEEFAGLQNGKLEAVINRLKTEVTGAEFEAVSSYIGFMRYGPGGQKNREAAESLVERSRSQAAGGGISADLRWYKEHGAGNPGEALFDYLREQGESHQCSPEELKAVLRASRGVLTMREQRTSQAIARYLWPERMESA